MLSSGRKPNDRGGEVGDPLTEVNLAASLSGSLLLPWSDRGVGADCTDTLMASRRLVKRAMHISVKSHQHSACADCTAGARQRARRLS